MLSPILAKQGQFILRNMAQIVRKANLTKMGCKIQAFIGKFLPLRTLQRNLHMFLDILESRVENKKDCLGKTVLKMSQKSTRRPSFVQRIRRRL